MSREKVTVYILLPVLLIAVSVSLSGCALKRGMVISASKTLLSGSMTALLSESDLAFARSGMESDLKLLEGLINVSPEDEELLVLAAQGYSGYALIYLEETEPERAAFFYRRARDYGMRALQVDIPRINSEMPLDEFDKTLTKLDGDDVSTAYWTAVAWGSMINLELSSPSVIAQYPKAVSLMNWVYQTDSSYYHYGSLWFLASFSAALPKMMGGDLDKSRTLFTEADSLCGGRFLMGKVLFARTYAVTAMDKPLFEKLLGDVIARGQSGESIPELRLLNSAAVYRAERLLKRTDDLF